MPAPPSRPPGRSGTFASLRERDFAWYFVGNTSFFLAMQMNMLLPGWYAYELTGRALSVGLIAVAIALPMLFVGPLGGVIADRQNKRTLLILGQSLVAAANLVLTVLILTDRVEFWHVLSVSAAVGLSFAVVMPTRQAMVPLLVPQHRMMNAISLQMGSVNVTRIVGPALAGVLIDPLGIGVVWGITVVLFALAVLTVLPLPVHGMRGAGASHGLGDDLLSGFRYIARRPLLRVLIVTGMLMPLFVFPVQMVLPVFAEEVFDRGPSAVGILMAAAGAGGLVGTLLTANMDHMPRKGLIMLGGATLIGVCYVIFALSSSFWLALAVFGVGNIGGMVLQVTNQSTIQAVVDDEIRGRVMSVMMMSFGIMPLGILPLTIAIDAFGAPATVATSSVLSLALLWFIFMVSSQLRRLRLDALAHAELSPAQAAKLVAEGKLTREEAAQRTGRAHGAPAAASLRSAELNGAAAPDASEPGERGVGGTAARAE